jgi:integrase/recombinase XerD
MYPKIILFKSKTYSDGSHPVMIQVISNRKSFRKVLFKLAAKDFDLKNNRVKNAHYLSTAYNHLIIQTLQQMEAKIINAKLKSLPITKEYLFDDNVNNTTLIDAIRIYQTKLTSEKKYTAIEKYDAIANKLSDFGNIDIALINKDWIQKFYKHLLTFNGPNTAKKNIDFLKTVLRHQDFTDKSVLDFEMVSKKTTKNKLSKDEIERLKELPVSGLLALTRDCFLLSFYLRGMRIGDVLTLEYKHVKNGRILREARKTDKAINLFIGDQAQNILDKYKGKSEYYLLPIMKMMPPVDPDEKRFRKQIEAKTTLMNKYLKILAEMCEIDKVLTTHVARHTFAYLADQSGMTSKRIQDLLNHSDLKTTENYINDLNNSDMLDKTMDDFLKDY